MKIKELRALLKGLPANMEVVINTGLTDEELQQQFYSNITLPVRKAKKKLVRKIGDYNIVQSRPHKDEKATLKLVLE